MVLLLSLLLFSFFPFCLFYACLFALAPFASLLLHRPTSVVLPSSRPPSSLNYSLHCFGLYIYYLVLSLPVHPPYILSAPFYLPLIYFFLSSLSFSRMLFLSSFHYLSLDTPSLSFVFSSTLHYVSLSSLPSIISLPSFLSVSRSPSLRSLGLFPSPREPQRRGSCTYLCTWLSLSLSLSRSSPWPAPLARSLHVMAPRPSTAFITDGSPPFSLR